MLLFPPNSKAEFETPTTDKQAQLDKTGFFSQMQTRNNLILFSWRNYQTLSWLGSQNISRLNHRVASCEKKTRVIVLQSKSLDNFDKYSASW